MFCYNCGTQLKEGANFCRNCGIKINSSFIECQEGESVDERSSVNYDIINDSEVKESLDTSSYKMISNETDEESSKTDSSGKVVLIVGLIGLTMLFGMPIFQSIYSFLEKIFPIVIGILFVEVLFFSMFIGLKEEKIEARKTVVKLVGGFIIILIVVIVFAKNPEIVENIMSKLREPGAVQNIVDPGFVVKKSYLTQYSDTITIEDAFGNYFRNPKWDTHKSDGYSYVTFTGTYNNQENKIIDVKIYFKILGEQFNVERLDLNGIEQNNLVLHSLLLSIYEK